MKILHPRGVGKIVGTYLLTMREHLQRLYDNRVWLFGLWLGVLLPGQIANAQESDPLFAKIATQAADLASRPYVAPVSQLPAPLKDLDFDRYRKIQFHKDQALWRNETSFEVEFFHRGFLYVTPVTIHVVEGKDTRPLDFNKGMFSYKDLNIDPAALPNDMGFAGFRIHYPLNRPDYKDEVAVFLGASYFRILSRNQAYGASARGIAIDTAEASGEEFPAFRDFWLVKPDPEANVLIIYALLDGPSLTGAYRFDIHPGAKTAVSVNTRLFFRKKVKRLGIAPLTSMFLYGENITQVFDDIRPEVHDSDGLLIHNNAEEWIWRPLINPRSLRVSSFLDEDPQGFGLIQRDRNFENYLDIGVRFEQQPSFWVKPEGGAWNQGSIQLIEIPSREDINDNIVAFWSPKVSPQPGGTLNYRYTLYAESDHKPETIGRVTRTRVGWAGQAGQKKKPPKTHRRFIVEFSGDGLAALDAKQPVKVELATTNSHISDLAVTKVPQTGAWRVAFQLRPKGEQTADIRLFLTLRKERLTETWNYLWSPNDIP
ncbi:MAG: glucan biosynthesis protein G [Rhodospirillales bacterium]